MATKKEKIEWSYWLGDPPVMIVKTTKRPRIGARIMSAGGTEWEVWYIEEGAGAHNARLEKVPS